MKIIDVSIIIPIYNTEKYLHECLNSALNENEISTELILINDGSIDGSLNIAKHYRARHSNIKLISQENLGQGTARNRGLEQATGKYVYFLDSDDHLAKGALKKLFDTSEKYGLELCSPGSPKHYYEKPLEFVSCIPSRMQFVRRDIITDNQIEQPTSRSGQDGVFGHLILCNIRKFGIAHDARLHYKDNRPGSTFANYVRRTDLVHSIINSHYDFISQYYEDENYFKKNAIKLLYFVSDETIKNRIGRHIERLDEDELISIVELIKPLVEKAYAYLPREYYRFVPPVVRTFRRDSSVKTAAQIRKYLSMDITHTPTIENQNVHVEGDNVTLVSLFSGLVPGYRKPKQNNKSIKKRTAESQNDYTINLINHNTIQTRLTELWDTGPLGAKITNAPIISLTTIESRLPMLHYSIGSLLCQSIRPSKFIVWLSDKFDFRIENYPRLEKFQQMGVEFRPVTDVGPHTKLIYALQEFSDHSIVTFDDDQIYTENALEMLYRYSSIWPHAIIANWVREIPEKETAIQKGIRGGQLLTPPTLEAELESNTAFIAEEYMTAFPYGTGGICYPPQAFDRRVFDLDLMRELCPTEDDVWFRAMSILKGTPVVPTNLGINPVHFSVMGSQAHALRYINHGSGGNSSQLCNTFRYFELFDALNKYRKKQA